MAIASVTSKNARAMVAFSCLPTAEHERGRVGEEREGQETEGKEREGGFE